jgi:hypothetical protein
MIEYYTARNLNRKNTREKRLMRTGRDNINIDKKVYFFLIRNTLLESPILFANNS